MSQLKSLIDLLLTNVSVGYFPKTFICEQAFPYIPVVHSTGKLGKYGTSHLRIESSIRGGRGKFKRVEAIVRSTSSYSIDEHGLEGLVTPSDYRNVLDPFDAERDETLGITTMLYLEKEYALASALGSTATMTSNTTLTGTAQFNDYDNSDPLGICATARETIYTGCGLYPNVAIMSRQVRNKLKYHPAFMDFFKFSRAGDLKDSEIAEILDVEKILVGEAVYESAKEGQTSSLASVWGKNLIFAVLPEKAELYQKSLGYRMGYSDQAPRQVFKFAENNPPGANAILVQDAYQFLIQDVNCGYLIKNAIA